MELINIIDNKEHQKLFAKFKVNLIKYHIKYAEELGITDSIAINYTEEQTLRNLGKPNYSYYLIKVNNEFVGCVETIDNMSDLFESSIFVNNFYLSEGARGMGLFNEYIEHLKTQYENIEFHSYYDLPIHEVSKKLGAKRIMTHYFL